MIIRKGIRADIPQAFELIKELAEYEKAPQEVTNTIEMMYEDGFGDRPVFDFLVAEKGNVIVGLALYYFRYSTWKGKCIYLEDLVVKQEFRRYGIGKMLFDALIKEAQNEGVNGIQWQVLDWNTPAIRFYEKLNSNFDSEWINCKLTKSQIQNYFTEA